MWRANYVWKPYQRRILWRLFHKNVECRSGETPALQRIGKRSLVNQFATSRVHDARGLLHFLNRFGVDHFLRGGAQRRMHGDKIALRQQALEADQFYL